MFGPQIGGAIITPGSGPLVSPSQIKPGSDAGRIGGGDVGMWSVLVGAVVGLWSGCDDGWRA
jgi:hypothetical protein